MGKFLHGKLAGTKYLSKRGGAKRITDLFNDITDFYKGASVPNHKKVSEYAEFKINYIYK